MPAPYMKIPDEMLYKFARNSTGSIDLSFTTSGTTAAPVDYSYTVPAEKIGLIRRCNIAGYDGSITPSKFMGIAALANGVMIEAMSSGSTSLIDFTDGHYIKRNSDWGFLAGVDVRYNIVAGDDGLDVRWTIGRAGAILYLTSGESLTFKVQDDLSAVSELSIMVQGLELSSID